MKRFNPSQVGYKPILKVVILDHTLMFQSLTGRLQTGVRSFVELTIARFNPSQVGYKRGSDGDKSKTGQGFNPSQVGYKLLKQYRKNIAKNCFNPSQVGYKRDCHQSAPP